MPAGTGVTVVRNTPPGYIGVLVSRLRYVASYHDMTGAITADAAIDGNPVMTGYPVVVDDGEIGLSRYVYVRDYISATVHNYSTVDIYLTYRLEYVFVLQLVWREVFLPILKANYRQIQSYAKTVYP